MKIINTIEYLGIWEYLYNPNFKPLEFEGFMNEAGSNAFTLSPQKWVENTTGTACATQQRSNYTNALIA